MVCMQIADDGKVKDLSQTVGIQLVGLAELNRGSKRRNRQMLLMSKKVLITG